MGNDDTTSQPAGQTRDPEPLSRELILELNFVPKWARHPPPRDYAGAEPPERERRRPPREGTAGRRTGRGAGRRDTARPRARPPRLPRPAEPPPARIQILPDQKQLGSLVRQIRSAGKAYPLGQVASLLLSNPDYCAVKIEIDPRDPAARLYECRACGRIAARRDLLLRHLAEAHLEEYFESEEIEQEAPQGNFVCVSRCGLSGFLLGPPNHHSTEQRIREIHQARYPDLALQEYRQRTEMTRDAETIERWKQEYRRQKVYRPKSGAGADTDPLSRFAAEIVFCRDIAPKLVIERSRIILPGRALDRIDDPGLTAAVRRCWDREARSPASLLLALQAAFDHMRLYVFRTAGGQRFVSPIRPAPLAPDHAVESIRDVLTFLRRHPGETRKGIVGKLRPGVGPDDPAAAELLFPLGWLIERGHIIEFFDGSLSVPLHGAPRRRAARTQSGRKRRRS